MKRLAALFAATILLLLSGCAVSGTMPDTLPAPGSTGLYRVAVDASGSFVVTPYTPAPQPTVTVTASPSPTATPTPTPTPTPIRVFSVKDYGAHGDGTTDDVAHIQSAIAAAGRTPVYFPAGTYKLSSTLTVPNGTTLVGAGMATVWLKGKVVFGSSSSFTDLKMGDAHYATQNGSGASTTSFTRCQFRGGGGTGVDGPVLRLGSSNSCDHLTFTDCNVERNLGTENSTLSLGYNDIGLVERTDVHCAHITFTRCHIGVTNGVATGSPRFGCECYTDANDTHSYSYDHVTFDTCIFEQTDAGNLDLADSLASSASYCIVTGCTFKGAGLTHIKWGHALCVELPATTYVTNNTFWGSWLSSLMVTNSSGQTGTAAAQITGNTFNLTQGVATSGDAPIVLKDAGNVFTGNTIDGNHGTSTIIALWNATGNTVTGNTFTNRGAATAIHEYTGCSGNTLTPNTGT